MNVYSNGNTLNFKASYIPGTRYEYHLGLTGCKRIFLYILMAIVIIIVLINAILIIWILVLIGSTSETSGSILVEGSIIKLNGQTYLLDRVYIENIKSSETTHLSIKADNGINIVSKGIIRISIESNKIKVNTDLVKIKNSSNDIVFDSSDNKTTLIANKFIINNKNGLELNASIQVPWIRSSESISRLIIKSFSRCVFIRGPVKVAMQSDNGDISLNSLKNVHLKSTNDQILLNSSVIQIDNLRTIITSKRKGFTYPDVMQLCSCLNGKLFMAPPDILCLPQQNICNYQRTL